MNRSVNRLSVILFFADIFWVCLGLFSATQLRFSLPLGEPLEREFVTLPLLVYPLAVVCWSFSLITAEAYHPQKVLRAVNEIRRVVTGSLLATLLLAGSLYFTYRQVSRIQFIYFYLTTTILILFYRGLIRVYSRITKSDRGTEAEHILIVGAGDLGLRLAKVIQNHSRWGMDLVGFLDDDLSKVGWKPSELKGISVLGTVDQILQITEDYQITEVYFALPSRAYQKLENLVAKLQRKAIKLKVVPDYFSLAMVHAQPEVIGGLPVINLRAPVIEGTNRLIKRIFDLTVSALLIFFLWPILLLIAVLIRLDSPGPAIFRQQRVGENGKLFVMYKFRTMVMGAEEHMDEMIQYDQEGNIIHKTPQDPRITPLGRLLRRTSLDEFPQLLNVLKGDMSLVGPRPELPWLVEKYKPWQRKRFAVPQGITGWWQVNKRAEELMHLSTEDDLYYVYNYSLWLDIKILLLTFKALFRGY